MEKIKIICNPSSGRQLMQRKIDHISKMLLDSGYTVKKFNTRKKNDAMLETIKTCKEDWDAIVACGGDGTINEVAKGIVKGGRKLPVALLATGTVNDFANYMELPTSSRDFFNMIKKGKTIDVDIGKVNDEYFINVAASGLLTNVGYQVQPEMKAILGRLAYYLEGLKEIPRQKFNPIKVRFESDEYTAEEEILLFLVSNSSSIGGFKNLAPKANVSDGLLDTVIIRKSDIQDLVAIFINIFKGDHVNHPNVEYFKTNKLTVHTYGNVPVDIDGEYGGKLPVSFEVLPESFRIFVK